MLFVLLVVPGGLASLVVRLRDVYVGWVLRRRAEVPVPAAPAPAPERELEGVT